MLRLPMFAVLALGAAVLVRAEDASGRDFGTIDDIEWSYRSALGDQRPQLRLEREGMNSSFDASDMPAIADTIEPLLGEPGADIAFSLAREAGALACTGKVVGAGRAAGNCRFDPDEAFVRALAARGLQPEDSEEILGLALVDAHVAVVDGLSREGFAIEDVDELMAVSALEVTPAFAAELREAGIAAEDVDNLIAARALEVDGAWVRNMAEAGYADLDLEQAIELRALGITPDYARRMRRVLSALDGVEEE